MTNAFENLSRQLSRLPGLGRKSAERAALGLVRQSNGLLDSLLEALQQARDEVRLCRLCGAVTSVGQDPCRLCTDVTRDDSLLCVVEEPGDILAMERSGGYRGRYHALLGKLSAARAAGPSDLRMRELSTRLVGSPVREVIIAISTDMEGDATAAYIAELLRGTSVALTRLAFGLPADSGVGYSDALTLKRALNGRQKV